MDSAFVDHSADYLPRLQSELMRKNSSDRSLKQLLLLASILTEFDWETVRTIAEKLVLSNEEIERLLLIQKHLQEVSVFAEKKEDISDRELYRFFVQVKEASLDICLLSMAIFEAGEGEAQPTVPEERILNISKKILDTWFNRPEVAAPIPLLNGNDLMMNFDLTPGPLIGKLIEGLKEEQAAGEILDRAQALEWIEKRVNERRWSEEEGF